jgi:hypothetical protein
VRLCAKNGAITFNLAADDVLTVDLDSGELWWCDPTAEGRHIFPGTKEASSAAQQRMNHRVDPVTSPTISVLFEAYAFLRPRGSSGPSYDSMQQAAAALQRR